MKKLFLSLAFLVGMTGLSHAARQDNGWIVTTVTGTAQTVATGTGLIYLKSIWLSSATTGPGIDYVVAFNTVPTSVTGAGVGLFSPASFSTTVVVGPIMYLSSTTANGAVPVGNQRWTAGDCESCYLEVPQTLHIRQTTQQSGGAFNVQVMWSR